MSIRFILEVAECDRMSGYEGKQLITLDADVPSLEAQLRRGGFGQEQYLVVKLIGAEVRDATKDAA